MTISSEPHPSTELPRNGSVVLEQLSPLTTKSCNDPESQWLTDEDRALFDNARTALVALKKTFESWAVIGRAVVCAREIADHRGGRDTFKRLLDQQGLAEIAGDKASISRLLQIMTRLPEVETWRATLTARQRIDWAAPNTVFKHCPVFGKKAAGNDGITEPRPSPIAKVKQENAEKDRKIAELEQRIAKFNHGGGQVDFTEDSANQIAEVVFRAVSKTKWRSIVNAVTAKFQGSAP